MTITRKTLGALALGLAVATAASPSFAQRAENGMSDTRANISQPAFRGFCGNWKLCEFNTSPRTRAGTE